MNLSGVLVFAAGFFDVENMRWLYIHTLRRAPSPGVLGLMGLLWSILCSINVKVGF